MSELPMPLYARLRDVLRGAILEARLKPGAKLPSESELSAAHAVSRITVRQALAELQQDGLIIRLQGKGAFVSQPRASQSLDRLQGLREALSGQGQAVHSKRLSMKKVSAPAALARQLALQTGAQVYQLMTLRYLDRQPLSVNCSFFAPALGERIARLDLSGRDLIEILEHDLGKKVAQAHLDISAVRMPTREGRLLKVTPGEPALRVHRVLCAQQELPLQTETALYRADAFSYQMILRR